MAYLVRSLAIWGFVAFLVGCGGPSGPPRGIVRGQVTLDGKPLPNATVMFRNDAIGVAQSAMTGADGKYEFIAYEQTGLPAASYKVTVSSARFMQPGEETKIVDVTQSLPNQPPPANVPAIYTDAATSGLSADVNQGNNPPFDFDLKS
ncbi:MAG TPA: carboxypeptidase-like regulatory domain-containing protein [Pirellulaceae bacterium]|jgi:hypothetical protein|nr:carboxypeptidase-like regulatory domain-containing protein [Pirellulaceae bacterium]